MSKIVCKPPNPHMKNCRLVAPILGATVCNNTCRSRRWNRSSSSFKYVASGISSLTGWSSYMLWYGLSSYVRLHFVSLHSKRAAVCCMSKGIYMQSYKKNLLSCCVVLGWYIRISHARKGQCSFNMLILDLSRSIQFWMDVETCYLSPPLSAHTLLRSIKDCLRPQVDDTPARSQTSLSLLSSSGTLYTHRLTTCNMCYIIQLSVTTQCYCNLYPWARHYIVSSLETHQREYQQPRCQTHCSWTLKTVFTHGQF